jgi:hypothetical protein
VLLRAILKHITSFLLIAIVLVSSLQLSVTKMTCLMTGKVLFSVEDLEDCNPSKKDGSITTKCCDFHKITFDNNINSFSSITDFSFINLDLIAVQIPPLIELIKFNEASISFFHNLPPPLSGIALLKTIQVFRL